MLRWHKVFVSYCAATKACTSFVTSSARPAGRPKITSHFLRLYVSLCVHTYQVRKNYVTRIVAMRPYLS